MFMFLTVIKTTGTNEGKVFYFNEVRRLLASCCTVVTSTIINVLEMYDLISRPAPWVLGMWLWWRSGNDQVCLANTFEKHYLVCFDNS